MVSTLGGRLQFMMAIALIASVGPTVTIGQAAVTGPCVQAGTNPIGVVVDPGCVTTCNTGSPGDIAGMESIGILDLVRTGPSNCSSSSSGGSILASAAASGTSVLVEWEMVEDENRTAEDITEIHILRGTTTDQLAYHTSLPPGTWSYLDEGALLNGEAFWYAVEVVYDDEHVELSEPGTIQGAYLPSS